MRLTTGLSGKQEGSRQHCLLYPRRPEVDTQQQRRWQHHSEEREQEQCFGPHGSSAFPVSPYLRAGFAIEGGRVILCAQILRRRLADRGEAGGVAMYTLTGRPAITSPKNTTAYSLEILYLSCW